MKTKLAAVAVLALLLVGCSPIDSGTITDKHHREGYYQTTYVQQCMAYDKNGSCTQYITVPQTTYYPPSWTFDLRKGDEKGWVGVSEGTYDSYEIGDYYPREGSR